MLNLGARFYVLAPVHANIGITSDTYAHPHYTFAHMHVFVRHGTPRLNELQSVEWLKISDTICDNCVHSHLSRMHDAEKGLRELDARMERASGAPEEMLLHNKLFT